MTNVIASTYKVQALAKLAKCEERIEAIGISAWLDLGRELKTIKYDELYQSGAYNTWDDYVFKRWGWRKNYADKLISACNIYEKLGTNCTLLPNSEGQIRPLKKLAQDDEKIGAWNEAVETARGKVPTEECVKGVVNRIMEDKRKVAIASKPAPSRGMPRGVASESQAPTKPAASKKTQTPVVSPTPIALAPQLDEPAPSFITIDEWKKLPRHKRDFYMNGVNTKKTFNKQAGESIEWAQWSWNPVTGCKHDCVYCYARDLAMRYYEQKFEPAFIPDRVKIPFSMQVPAIANNDIAYRNVFTCSMADLFGRWVPKEWIESILGIVGANSQWNFLFLTKFPKRMAEFQIPDNAWMGTTVDEQRRVKAAQDAFANVKSGVRWLSVEPMLEPLKFKHLDRFHWVVIGGASKSTKTPEWVPNIDWIVDLHKQARDAGCRIYYKTNTKLPEELRIREFPWGDAPAQRQLPASFRA